MTDTAAIHKRLADAYRELAEIHDELAGRTVVERPAQLQALPAQRPQVHVPAAPSGVVHDVDISTTCPKHNVTYRRGNYGLFCPVKTDDPAFSDRKGYCNLPGDNAERALAWVAIQRAVQHG